MQVFLILIGALLGAAVREGTGFLIGAAVGWLVWRSLQQRREIDELKRLLAQPAPQPMPLAPRESEPAGRSPHAVPGITEPLATDMTSPARSPVIVDAATEAATEAAIAKQGDPAPEPAAPPPLPPATPGKPSVFDTARQWLFGGNTIVKAGIGILFIGLAFLAKYASEHVSLPIELRLATTAAVALVLLVLGWRLRGSRAGYAQVLQGGAIAVLYLTLFAAFRFYGVIGAGSAFALMAVVAAAAAALAVLQDARSLAVVGALGGFATPLLLSTGGGSHIGLFGYYLVLCGGIAAVAWFRTWRELNLIGFFFSFGVATTWGLFKYRPEDYLSAQLFLVAFFLVFMAVLLLPARRVAADAAPPKGERWVNGTLLFGLPTLAFGLQYGLVKDMAQGPALSALVAAAFYIVLAWRLRARPHLALAFEGCLAVGTIFVTLVIPFALEPHAVSGAWALEGAGLVWLGWRQQRRLARALGYLLLLVAGGVLLHAAEHHAAPTAWINATLLTGLLLVAGALIAARATQQHAPPLAAVGLAVGERIAESLLIALALLACVSLITLHVLSLVQPTLRLSALIAGTALVALLFTVLADRLNWRRAATPLLLFAPMLGLFSVLGVDVQRQPFMLGGWWAWPLALAVHALTLQRAAVHWPAVGVRIVHTVGALVVAMLGASLGRGLMADAGDAGSAWPWLGWLAVPALLLLVLPRPATAGWWPVRLHALAYQRDAALVMTLALLGWTLLANILSRGAAEPLPYVPLLNPLDLGVALALFAAWRFSASEAGQALLVDHPRLVPTVLGASGFVWLNAMLIRGFHHLGGFGFEFHQWSRSLPVQTGLTLLWSGTAMALMWFSARRGQRAPWMVGAALLAAVVLKLLLVDLSGSGTVTRIVSFIGAGVLMLVIGYVAPLPGSAVAAGKDVDAKV